jgi:hypothetical protein
MEDPCILYKSQFNKAKETLHILEKQKAQIDLGLLSNPICSTLHKELRTVNLDIKITVNELEHAESGMQKCKTKYNSTSK